MAKTPQEREAALDARLATQEKRLRLDQIRVERRIARAQGDAISGMASFAAAEKNRLTRDWPAGTKSADQAILPDASTLNARARHAYWNNCTAGSMAGAKRRNVVGTGITVRSAARDPITDEPFDEFNHDIDRLWVPWSQNPLWCDVERRKTFLGFQQLAVQEWFLVGEGLTLLGYQPRPEMVGLTLQMIEPEQLDTTKTKNAVTGNEIRGGVEIDKYGAPVAYWIHTAAHPLERSSTGSTRVPIQMELGQQYRVKALPTLRQVLHLFRQDRVRQTRGVTRLCRSLVKMQHLEQYIIYQLVAARGEAAWGGFLKTGGDPADVEKMFSLPRTPGDTGLDAHGAKKVAIEPGTMGVLPPGVEPVFHEPNRPGGQFDPFTRSLMGQIGAGADMDYDTVARDYDKGTFSSKRQGLIENQKETDSDQLLMIDLWCRPMRTAFKVYAILEGRVKAPGFFDDPVVQAAYLADDWQGPPKPWISPKDMALAAKTELMFGITPLQDIHNRLGVRTEEVLRKNAEALRLAEKLGVPLAHLQLAGPKPAPEPEPAAPPPTAGKLAQLMAASGAGALTG